MSKLRGFIIKCKRSSFLRDFCKGGIAANTFINSGGDYGLDNLLY